MGQLRIKKVAGVIKNELSLLISRKLRDPRLNMVTITEVRLNKDMSIATVFFSTLGDTDNKKELQDVLDHASSFLRSQLLPVLRLRKIPELKFEVDNSFEYGMKIENLINKIHDDSSSEEENDGQS